jgi:XTP/dITP diphosphohydrolase
MHPWEGLIGTKEIGNNGFGYDPLFYLPEHSCTAAELSEKQKNAISHRGKALKEFQKKFII